LLTSLTATCVSQKSHRHLRETTAWCQKWRTWRNYW